MRILNLKNYSDKEIVTALMSLDAIKFMQVVSAIATIATKTQERGELIARQQSEEIIDDLMRRLGGEEE